MEKINRIFLEKFDNFKKVIELISYKSINDIYLITKDIKKCRFTNTTLIFSNNAINNHKIKHYSFNKNRNYG